MHNLLSPLHCDLYRNNPILLLCYLSLLSIVRKEIVGSASFQLQNIKYYYFFFKYQIL